MLKFSKKVEYALIAMVHMNNQSVGQLITARELADAFNIPQEVVGKVMQKLARKGIVSSVQGVKGGYQLAARARDIDLATIINAIDGPMKVVNCVEAACECGQMNYCNMRNPMETIQQRLSDFFSAISLQDFQYNRIPEYQKVFHVEADFGSVNPG